MAKLKSLFHFIAHILSGKTESSQREVFTPIGSDDLGNIKTYDPDPTFRHKIISSKKSIQKCFLPKG